MNMINLFKLIILQEHTIHLIGVALFFLCQFLNLSGNQESYFMDLEFFIPYPSPVLTHACINKMLINFIQIHFT